MKDSIPHLALREWRIQMGRPVALVVWVAVGVLLTIVGPFDTLTNLRPAPRFIYWLLVSGATYSVGFMISFMMEKRFAATWPKASIIGLSAALTGLGVLLIVFLANWITFDYIPFGTNLLVFASTVLAVTLILSVVFSLLSPAPLPDAENTTVSILDRLSLEKRGTLVALSVEDHYVRIRTNKGEDLVLMRLADAIREAATPGLQVHRSHWIATGAVTAARREGDRAVLTMTTGPDIPVSRRYVPAIRDAGLLPRS